MNLKANHNYFKQYRLPVIWQPVTIFFILITYSAGFVSVEEVSFSAIGSVFAGA